MMEESVGTRLKIEIIPLYVKDEPKAITIYADHVHLTPTRLVAHGEHGTIYKALDDAYYGVNVTAAK